MALSILAERRFERLPHRLSLLFIGRARVRQTSCEPFDDRHIVDPAVAITLHIDATPTAAEGAPLRLGEYPAVSQAFSAGNVLFGSGPHWRASSTTEPKEENHQESCHGLQTPAADLRKVARRMTHGALVSSQRSLPHEYGPPVE